MYSKDEVIKYHIKCNLCSSKDDATLYRRSNGKEYAHCYSCNQKEFMNEENSMVVRNEPKASNIRGSIGAIPSRDITKETAQYYQVTQDKTDVMFPYPGGGFKIRSEGKKFSVSGKLGGLFGQDRFPAGGKYITVTEGEYDALAAFQMLGSKYPVVSVPNGAAGAIKAVKESFEWLNTFEHIVICFDQDEPGQKAAKEVGELLGSKARIVKLAHFKDANEYLMQRKSADFVNGWWRAEQFVPDGIVSGVGLWDKLNKPAKTADALYPFAGLNKLTYGIRFGELVTFVAGSGLGKSQSLREIQHYLFKTNNEKIGIMMLEESVEKSALSLMSIQADKPLHLPGNEITEEYRKKLFDEVLGSDRFYFFDHFGSTGIDNIVNRVRYLAKGLGCKYVFLDHVSIVVSAQSEGDERKALDEIMTKLRMLVQETNISLIIVSHLKRPEGKGHEEGAATGLNQLRGSASIAQLSDIVIGIERDAQNSDEIIRNTTHFRVLKNRFSGITGPAGSALYSLDTGRMTDYEPIDTEEVL